MENAQAERSNGGKESSAIADGTKPAKIYNIHLLGMT